jgi:hypothetical protein
MGERGGGKQEGQTSWHQSFITSEDIVGWGLKGGEELGGGGHEYMLDEYDGVPLVSIGEDDL